MELHSEEGKVQKGQVILHSLCSWQEQGGAGKNSHSQGRVWLAGELSRLLCLSQSCTGLVRLLPDTHPAG